LTLQPPASAGPTARLPAFLWVLALGNFVVGTGAFVIGGMIEPMSAALGLSVSTTGQLTTVYALSNAVATPVLLGIAGRYDARTVLLFAMALLAVASAGSALAAGWGELALARVVTAFGAGLFTPTAAALGVGLAPPAARGRALSVTFSGIGLSYIVGMPFGAWASFSSFGWPLAFWGIAGAAAAVTGLLLRAPRGVATSPASMAGYVGVLRDRRAMLSLAISALYFASIFGIFSYVGGFLRDYVGVSAAGIVPVLAAFGVAALVGTFAGGALADRFGPTRMLYAICACFVAVFAVVWAMPGRTAPLLAVFFFWGTIGFAFYAAQQSRLVSIAPRQATVMLALNATMLYLGTAAGAAMGGAVIASVGYRGLPVMAALLIAGVALLVRLTEPPPGPAAA
jgi:MFS transporter, DHA1 family, inner membrane transport protein